MIEIPKEIAYSIENAWENYKNNAHPKHIVLTNWKFMETLGSAERLVLLEYATKYPIEYMTALVNGYTVKQTKEEKVKEYYERFDNHQLTHFMSTSEKNNIQNAMKFVLETYDIKIEGVND